MLKVKYTQSKHVLEISINNSNNKFLYIGSICFDCLVHKLLVNKKPVRTLTSRARSLF